MRSCGVISAVFLALIAVPALIISVLYNGIAQTVLVSPSFIERLAPADLQSRYQVLGPYLVRDALNQPDGQDTLMTTLFPDPATRATIRQLLPGLLEQRNGDFSPESIQQLLDRDLPVSVRAELQKVPLCTADAEASLAAFMDIEQIPGLRCAPQSAELTQQLITVISAHVRRAFDTAIAASSSFAYTQNDVTRRISELRAGAVQSIMLPATLMILIVAFAVRSRRQLFGWLGGILLSSAVLGFPIMLNSGSIDTREVERIIIQDFTRYAGQLLPIVTVIQDAAFRDFIGWSTSALFMLLGSGFAAAIVALALPKPSVARSRTLQPMGPHAPILGDGSTHRVQTDFETSALQAEPHNTSQLPPWLDTSKLTFGRRMPKIPQPTQPITDMIPVGDQTNPIPTHNVTESLDANTQTQELGPKEDSRATQRTDEHRF